MKKILLLLALTALFSVSAFSQDAKPEKIKELFSLMKTDKMIDDTFDQVLSASKLQMNVSADQEILFKKSMERSKEMAKLLIDDMVEIYARYYTDEDVDALIKFYKSPTGKKTIEIQPTLMGEMMTLMSKKYMPEMMKQMEQDIKEIQK